MSFTRVALRPTLIGRLGVCALLLVAASCVVFAALSLRPLPAATVHCDRVAGICRYFVPALAGGTSSTDRLADWKSSGLVVDKQTGTAWQVTRATAPLVLGPATQDTATVTTYTKLSGDLQAFLADGSRATYDASYTPPRSSPLMMLAVGLLLGWLGVRLWRGWYATIDLDWTTRTVTIERRPMLFGGPGQLRFAADELRLGDGVERAIARGGRAMVARIELLDRSGKRVFAYTAAYDNRWRRRRNEELQQLVSFFGRPA